MNKKRTVERIATISLAVFLIAYFCYQVAYGIETTLWSNGTNTFGDLSPGSTITNMTGNAYNGSATINVGPPSPLDLTNTTWTIYNATSGSIGTITFKAYTVEKGNLTTNPPPTYIRHLHGKTLEGSWSMGTAVGQALELCSLHPHGSQSGCTDLTITTLSPNHIELQDSHGNTIRLMRNDIQQIAKAKTDCS